MIVVTCKEEDPRLDDVLKLLNEQEIHASEVIHIRHQLIGEVLQNTDSNILLYLPCDEDEEARYLNRFSHKVFSPGTWRTFQKRSKRVPNC